jgi:uncharacterized membrane protein YoaT (DUF817 family)
LINQISRQFSQYAWTAWSAWDLDQKAWGNVLRSRRICQNTNFASEHYLIDIEIALCIIKEMAWCFFRQILN